MHWFVVSLCGVDGEINENGYVKIERFSGVAAWLLSTAVVLSFLALQYQDYTSDPETIEKLCVFGPFTWAGVLAALSPGFVVLIFRRLWFVVAIYAVPILVVFVARFYYLWQLMATGVNSVSVYQKGDWAIWFELLLVVTSGVILFCSFVRYLIVLSSKYYIGGNR